jgi:starch synthase
VSGGFSVWHVTREYAGIAEAGGVKDVVRGLAEALARTGASPTVVLPLYGFLPLELRGSPTAASFSLSLPDQDRGRRFFAEEVNVRVAALAGVRMLLVEAERFASARDVYAHTEQDEQENRWRTRGTGHWDFHQKNLLLQRAALEAALALGEAPDVFHCHDGHTAFLPAILREDPRYSPGLSSCAALVTIHNAGMGYHQEVWDPEFAYLLTGLSRQVLGKALLNGAADPLLLAGYYATLVTVSEQYARDLLSEQVAETSGGLGKALRERCIPLTGITNGIDPSPYDPRTSNGSVPFTFDPSTGDLAGKQRCRQELGERLGGRSALDSPGPLYAFVGRLTAQKGIDILVRAMPTLVRGDPSRRFVILGRGDQELESRLALLEEESSARGRFRFMPRYDPALAALIYGASDFFMIPSAFEPCGLTDFIAQLLGSIPVVHRVGGLHKVREGETGFSYDEHTPAALAAAVDRTTRFFHEEPAMLERIRRLAFAEIFSLHTWDRVLADSYRPLYESLAASPAWTPR